MTKTAKAKGSVQPTGELIGVGLVDVDINLYGQEPTEATAAAYEYHIQIEKPSAIADELYTFPVAASIIRKFEGQEGFDTSIAAKYYCALKCNVKSDTAALDLAKKYAATYVWSAFASLSSLLAQQTGVIFPQLPVNPGEIEINFETEEGGLSEAVTE